MKASKALVFAVVVATVGLAQAQWVWLDAQGKKVFSDRAPGNEVPAKNILKQPNQSKGEPLVFTPLNAPAPANSSSSATPKAGSKPGDSDPALEAKKKQADAAEAAKQKAEQERQAQAKADNCNRAKQSKAALDSGRRMAQTTDKGEITIMNEEQRAAEMTRVQGIMAQNCN